MSKPPDLATLVPIVTKFLYIYTRFYASIKRNTRSLSINEKYYPSDRTGTVAVMSVVVLSDVRISPIKINVTDF